MARARAAIAAGADACPYVAELVRLCNASVAGVLNKIVSMDDQMEVYKDDKSYLYLAALQWLTGDTQDAVKTLTPCMRHGFHLIEGPKPKKRYTGQLYLVLILLALNRRADATAMLAQLYRFHLQYGKEWSGQDHHHYQICVVCFTMLCKSPTDTEELGTFCCTGGHSLINMRSMPGSVESTTRTQKGRLMSHDKMLEMLRREWKIVKEDAAEYRTSMRWSVVGGVPLLGVKEKGKK